MMRKFYALVVLAGMMAGLWSGAAFAAYYDEGNDGDSWETAYIIDSVEDFMQMRNNTNGEIGKYYKLTTDLDLTVNIDYTDRVFSGHFDGQNHTISLEMDGGAHAGLFDEIKVNTNEVAVINLNISGRIKGEWVGWLVWSISSGIIENCSFIGTITASSEWAGGITDLMWGGTIRNCRVKAQISSTHSGSGFVAELYDGNIENCVTESGTTITGKYYSGGTVGLMHGGRVTNCTTNVLLNDSVLKGGIVGGADTGASLNLSGNQWPDIYPQVGLISDDLPDDPTVLVTPLSSHKYTVFNLGMTWTEAKAYCESLGGHLATISSQEEQNIIEALILSSDRNSYWLGGQQDASGAWSWIDGSTWDYTHWATGQPDGYAEDFKLMMYRLSNPVNPSQPGTWNDIQNDGTHGTETFFGTDNFGFVCEWEPVEADFAPMNPEYIRYLEDPEAYFEGSEFYGDIPDPLDLSHLANNPPKGTQAVSSTFTVSALPAKYDPRTSGTLPPVRDQGSYGTCWSFASLGALETNYLAQKLGSTAPDTAELHQAWYVFKDKRSGYSFKLNRANAHVLNQGGSYSFSIPFLSRAGTASENELPYSTADNITSNPPSKLPEEYSNPIRLKEAYHIGAVNSSNRDEIKSLIRQRGAVAVSYSHEHNELSGSSYYYKTQKGYGHLVVAVGWDDDYPASNFKNRPSSNGAWLIRNSWGTNWGDSGYFWMSYEQAIAQCTAYIAAANTSGLKHKGYDVLTQAGSINYHWSANVFKAEGRETIKEVAFTTTDNNVPYEIYINHLGKTLPVNPGTPKNKAASGIMPYAGYHSITLSSPVELEDGEYFAVILKAGQASTYQYSTAVEDVVTVRTASVNTGESYFAKDENVPSSSDWKDGATILYNKTGRPCNACVKAFTVDATAEPEPVKPEPVTPDPEPDPVTTESGGSGGGGCSTSTTSAILAAVLAVKLRKH